MKSTIFFCAILLGIIATLPLVAQQQPAQRDDQTTVDQNIKVTGGLAVLSDDSLLTVLPIADLELHQRALVLRAIGQPLLTTGFVLTGLSAITWLTWIVSVFGTPLLTSFIGVGNIVTRQFVAITQPLLGVSIALTVTGAALLAGGSVLKVIGNDYQARSFTPQ